MAKLAVINRQAKRGATVKKYAEKRKQLLRDHPGPEGDRRCPRRGAREAAGAAPRRLPRAAAQPLRDHGPPARHVPQVRPRAQQDPRDRDARRDPRHDQGELVGDDIMSMSDPIADMLTRIRNAQATEKVSVVDAGLEGEAGHRPGPEGRGLHRGLRGAHRRGQDRPRDRPQVLRRQARDREDRARLAPRACASTRAATTFRAS